MTRGAWLWIVALSALPAAADEVGFPQGVFDRSAKVALVARPDSTLEAISTDSGRTRWVYAHVARPLWADRGRFVILESGPEGLAARFLEARRGKLVMTSKPFAGTADVRVETRFGPPSSFVAIARREGGGIVIAYRGGGPIHLSGVASVERSQPAPLHPFSRVRLDLATAELNPLDSTLTPPWETEIPIELSGAGNWRIRPRLLGERWFGVLWTESPPSTFEIVTAGGGAPRAIVRTLEGELVDTYNDDLVLLGPADRSEPFSVIRLTDGAQVGRLPRPPVGGMLGVRVFDGKTFGWINEPVRRDGGFNVVTYTFEARNLISGARVWTHRSVAKVPVWNPPP